jgi:hypothetical protein
MKSYIKGLITGGVLVFGFFVLTGLQYNTSNDEIMREVRKIRETVEFFYTDGVRIKGYDDIFDTVIENSTDLGYIKFLLKNINKNTGGKP